MVIARLDADLSAVQGATLSGVVTKMNYCNAIAIDSRGRLYVGGNTNSENPRPWGAAETMGGGEGRTAQPGESNTRGPPYLVWILRALTINGAF